MIILERFEGDVLRLEEGIYYKDNEANKNRKQYIEDKFRDMWEDLFGTEDRGDSVFFISK